MSTPFFDEPILNSPYEAPTRHHSLDADGQPLDEEPREGRRPSTLLTPVPKAKTKRSKKSEEDQLGFGIGHGFNADGQEYDPTPIINRIRQHIEEWRNLRNPADWGVTPTTQKLLVFCI